ncbi:hypothetical protein [Legionella oakridgensis]|uniref:Uncharacterized protein n=2 Tax=Legionella oakridgensis TaxID=29423 RepID=W0BGU9_9GAMM|nr:hypothetical protein [Legionella oakridgensis]AHE67936.1 hypothetical protein Loa_02394 [Legionella oakridgensis ATCC 33761 = DSM 21215]ETO92569.1 hypothetical protein LOR_63c16550 [Legionella oakridgensis RV-2-2007]KTD38755.1 hypothetical protein Loak_1243 [Legionella oakridgensis]STY20939.1 Uncharacterised protein [Legionella longbeachae]
MNSLVNDYPACFFNNKETPCISLYQPTHRTRPDKEQDIIRFKNLLKSIEKSLQQQYPEEEIQLLLKPFHSLMANHEFWNYTLDGMAVLATPNSFRVYTFPRSVAELAVVADTFHIKPLIRLMQTAERYQILGLNRERVKLLEGNCDGLEEVKLAKEVPDTIIKALGSELTEPHLKVSSYGQGTEGPAMHHGHRTRKDDIDLDAERFFRQVDETILKYHSRIAKLPLILAALPEYHHLFHKISENPYLLADGIKLNPDAASLDELREQAWKLMEPHYLKRLDEIINKFLKADSKHHGSDDLKNIAKAAVAGRVSTVLIDADKRIPGQINHESGDVKVNELLNPDIDDLLDDIGELVLKTHGDVIIVPSDKMPTTSGIAAIYRF